MRLVLVALVACGRFGFDAQPPVADEGGDAGFALDATVFGDGVVATAAACGATVLVSDGFDSGSPAPQFREYTASGLTIVETASHFEVDFAASVSGGSYTGYRTTAAYPVADLCGSVAALELPAGDGDIFMKLTNGTNQQVEFFEHSAQLDMRTHAGKNVATLASIPMDLVAHKYWLIRQQSGATYWETSADGVTYFTHVQTTFVTATALYFEIGGGTFQTLTNGGAGALDTALLLGP